MFMQIGRICINAREGLKQAQLEKGHQYARIEGKKKNVINLHVILQSVPLKLFTLCSNLFPHLKILDTRLVINISLRDVLILHVK